MYGHLITERRSKTSTQTGSALRPTNSSVIDLIKYFRKHHANCYKGEPPKVPTWCDYKHFYVLYLTLIYLGIRNTIFQKMKIPTKVNMSSCNY